MRNLVRRGTQVKIETAQPLEVRALELDDFSIEQIQYDRGNQYCRRNRNRNRNQSLPQELRVHACLRARVHGLWLSSVGGSVHDEPILGLRIESGTHRG